MVRTHQDVRESTYGLWTSELPFKGSIRATIRDTRRVLY